MPVHSSLIWWAVTTREWELVITEEELSLLMTCKGPEYQMSSEALSILARHYQECEIHILRALEVKFECSRAMS